MKVKNLIQENFKLENITKDVKIKSHSTDVIRIICNTCLVPYEATCKSIYAYIVRARKNDLPDCRHCSKSKCREKIQEYFEILTEGVKINCSSNEKIVVKCLENGHEFETTPHRMYVNCTTNGVINKCTHCKKEYKPIVSQHLKDKADFEFESVLYYTTDSGQSRRLYDVKLSPHNKENSSYYIEFDGPEHQFDPKVREIDTHKEELATSKGIPLVRIRIDDGDLNVTIPNILTKLLSQESLKVSTIDTSQESLKVPSDTESP